MIGNCFSGPAELRDNVTKTFRMFLMDRLHAWMIAVKKSAIGS